MTKFHFNPMVQALPALVHLSLFSFFAGLLIYLFNINHTVFSAVVCCVALSSAIYGVITFMPFFWLDSPYYSPLTQPARFLFTQFSYVIVNTLYDTLSSLFSFGGHHRIRELKELYHQQKDQDNLLVFLDAISKQSAEINFRILEWTVHLYGDDELENVFESIPGFLNSKKVTLDLAQAQGMTENAISEFLGNTLLSHSVSESVKVRRLNKCLNVASQVLSPVPRVMFHELVELNWDEAPHSVEIGSSLRTWDEGSNGQFNSYIRGVIAVIIAKVRERNVPWATFARHNLPTRVPATVFRDYVIHSDSVLLANLIHFMRRANRFEPFSIAVVRSLAKFDIRTTLPDLQRDFCAMWNGLVQEAQNNVEDSGNIAVSLLSEIRHLFTQLHGGSNSPLSMYFDHNSGSLWGPLDIPTAYPPCNGHGIAETAWLPLPLPLPATVTPFIPNFSHPESVSPIIAPPLANPDDTLTQPADEPTMPTMPTPIIQSSYPPPLAMPQPHPNPATTSDPPENTSSQAAVRRPTVSSVPNYSSLVTMPIPHPAIPPSDDSAAATVSHSPHTIPMVPLSPPTPSLPSSIATTSSSQFPMSSLSRSNQAPSDQESPTSSTTTILPVPRIVHQSSSEHDPKAGSSAATDDAPDESSV